MSCYASLVKPSSKLLLIVLISDYIFCRLSGDEFCIVIKDITASFQSQFADTLISCLRNGMLLSVGELRISISIGIATSEPNTKSFEDLMALADAAMYYAKKRGKNQYKLFDQSIAQDVLFRKQVAEKLRVALENNEFHLNFMPIYHVDSLKIHSAEVLIRCNAKSLQSIGPDIYIPIAEEFGLIKDIDLWVIETTFALISQHSDFIEQAQLSIAINISSLELHNTLFIQDIKKLITDYNIDTQCIQMEITETSLIETDELTITTLQALQNLGIKLALDDFGMGYTAFSQLINYPVDCLKIDKSFIDSLMLYKESEKSVLKAIFSIANAYHLSTTAEGVEEVAQLEYIRNNNCDYVQGYLLSKPMPWDSFVKEVTSPKTHDL
ncbi:bifunctional diguanylate cyclase/phosphodiesterase [Paraglaciecola aquimarina]|uniref:Bifunctional diguanylate cyclase/phosphodiesterase n=1 Tax=Paraglaciecola aquimarina TaxID=1235557 RepID=A0ABU3T1M1_9ALTE|nr:bifunctional diguanylate cyclase/phosphodiesterase [Paraglaciecola aquimarina]MDU0356141.1 bifunctional diguanylate cyclase/phosphodiesterase [Paraglaciecola aquimarina]